VKIRLSWQRRAVIIFAATIFLFSVILIIFAIREAEREKLIKEKEIEEAQQRLAGLIIDQVNAAISEAEGRIDRLVRDSQIQSHEKGFAEVCKRIAEGEEIVDEIFLIKEKGEVIFPLFEPIFLLPGEEQGIRERPVEIEAESFLKKAEISEFKTKNYPLAIKSYKNLMAATSDVAFRAVLMNRIGRCYIKSAKYPKAVETYQKILNESPREESLDGIPLRIIAHYQIGNIYWETGKKIKAGEAFFELYHGLLESRWLLTKTQFYFYRNKVKSMFKTSTAEINETTDGKNLMKKWGELERLEEERLKRMETIENLIQKVIPLIKTKRPVSAPASGRFHHLSETIEKELYLVSYTSINDNAVLSIRIDSEVLAKKLLPPILDKLLLRKEWHIQIKDKFGNTVAGEDIAKLINPTPQLTFSRGFEENFPPWEVNIFQGKPGLAQRQFNIRRNIYILSVAVVILAIFFGGFLAIKSTAKELELAKLKSEFVSTVSHELRTPLTSIRYLTELLQRGRIQGEDKKQKYYETITRESGRLSRLIENILDFSKIEAGVKEYELEETDISELARDVASRFEEQVDRKEFIIESEISTQMPKVSADTEALSRALFNLLDNALKYSGKVRNVFLRAWAEGESVFLEVKDEGVGISQQDQKKIFEKFYRTDDARESDIKGSGIGLTLVDHIVRAHGGEVILESDVGKGTKVTIKLPAKRKVDKKG
jgi:signal transduction histidine kinase